jgi:hypothetical protein
MLGSDTRATRRAFTRPDSSPEKQEFPCTPCWKTDAIAKNLKQYCRASVKFPPGAACSLSTSTSIVILIGPASTVNRLGNSGEDEGLPHTLNTASHPGSVQTIGTLDARRFFPLNYICHFLTFMIELNWDELLLHRCAMKALPQSMIPGVLQQHTQVLLIYYTSTLNQKRMSEFSLHLDKAEKLE